MLGTTDLFVRSVVLKNGQHFMHGWVICEIHLRICGAESYWAPLRTVYQYKEVGCSQ